MDFRTRRWRRLRTFLFLFVALFAFTGCDKLGGLYAPAPAQTITVAEDSVRDAHGDLVSVAALDKKQLQLLANSGILIKAGTQIEVAGEGVVIKPALQAGIQAARLLPIPYADVISGGLLSIFGIGATLKTRRDKIKRQQLEGQLSTETAQRRKFELVAEATMRGVDDFRDLLDQTAAGQVLDAKITDALRDRQAALGVIETVGTLLGRFQSPTKPRGTDIDAEIKAALGVREPQQVFAAPPADSSDAPAKLSDDERIRIAKALGF